ncbi:MAG: T9SS type A sorting domain-containing protein [Bacteroidetes bacterium]|nr:T9SS type A sorting domain-containing protein [Bacteroidota bacterium]
MALIRRPVHISLNTVGFIEVSELNPIQIYPNPSKDMLTIESIRPISNGTIEITNLQGQLLLHQNCENGKRNYMIDFKPYKSGLYFLYFKGDSLYCKTKNHSLGSRPC